MTKNTIEIGGHQAVICYEPECGMFRGEFLGLSGGADFYATDVDGLRREGALSLSIFLDECQKAGIEPRRSFSGKFMVRIDPTVHEAAAVAAAAHGQSLNQWVEAAIRHESIAEV